MKKESLEITKYILDGYIFYIIPNDDILEFYIVREDEGDLTFMFGINKNSIKNDDIEALILSNKDNFIEYL